MKRINYIILQVILSINLVLFGVLIELRGAESASGIGNCFLSIPGVVMFLSIFLAHIKYKQSYQFVLLVIVLDAILQVVNYLLLRYSLSSIWVIIPLIVSFALTILIVILFAIVYQGLPTSKKEKKNKEKEIEVTIEQKEELKDEPEFLIDD